MTPAHVVHAGFGRVLRGGPYCTNVFDKSVQSHMLWSHGWALAKVMMLFVVCNGFPAAVAGTLSLATGQLLVGNCILPCDDKGPTATLCFSTNLVVCGLAFVFWRSSKKVFLDKIYIHQIDRCQA